MPAHSREKKENDQDEMEADGGEYDGGSSEEEEEFESSSEEGDSSETDDENTKRFRKECLDELSQLNQEFEDVKELLRRAAQNLKENK